MVRFHKQDFSANSRRCRSTSCFSSTKAVWLTLELKSWSDSSELSSLTVRRGRKTSKRSCPHPDNSAYTQTDAFESYTKPMALQLDQLHGCQAIVVYVDCFDLFEGDNRDVVYIDRASLRRLCPPHHYTIHEGSPEFAREMIDEQVSRPFGSLFDRSQTRQYPTGTCKDLLQVICSPRTIAVPEFERQEVADLRWIQLSGYAPGRCEGCRLK